MLDLWDVVLIAPEGFQGLVDKKLSSYGDGRYAFRTEAVDEVDATMDAMNLAPPGFQVVHVERVTTW